MKAWLVNSLAHMKGSRPYDHNIASRENFSVIYLSLGEGYHNYHHTFPVRQMPPILKLILNKKKFSIKNFILSLFFQKYDYSASEYGWKSNFNLATAFIDLFAYLGLAYDRKVATNSAITARKLRTGEEVIALKKNSFIDYILGTIITTWPLWLTFALRAIYL